MHCPRCNQIIPPNGHKQCGCPKDDYEVRGVRRVRRESDKPKPRKRGR